MNNRRYFRNESFAPDLAPSPATTAQLAEIRRLLRLAEFDTRTVGYTHRRLGVADHEIGRPVDEWLDSLSKSAASTVIGKLRDVVGSDEDED